LATFSSTNFLPTQFTFAAPNPAVQYIGQFIINGGSLQFSVSGAKASGPILQNAAPVGIPTFADFLVKGPVVSGPPGDFTIIKSLAFSPGGVLQVRNDLTVTGTTDVDLGSLVVNGHLTAHQGLFLGFGGVLLGNGLITGNVFNSGLVSPGNSPGTLHIQGNYTQSGKGTLLTQIASRNSFDQLRISGHASLGGTLEIVATGNCRPQRHDSFKILTADGGISGHFDHVVNDYGRRPGALVYLGVDYTRNAVFLDAMQNTFKNALSIFKLTPNQNSVAAALDAVLNDPRQDAALTYLDNLDIRAVPGQLDKIAPEELTGLFSIGFAQTETVVLGIQSRLADLRLSREQGSAPSADPKAMGLSTDLQHGFFITATGSFTDVGNTANAKGYSPGTVGTLLGIDVRLNDNLVTGLALSYSHTESDLIDGGALRADGGKAALYAMYQAGSFFMEGIVGGGYSSYDTRRGALNGVARGSTSGGEFDAAAYAGYDVKLGKITLTPLAGLLYSCVGIDGYDEQGSLEPLNIHRQHQSSLSSRFGLCAAWSTQVGAATVTPTLRVEWKHEYGDDPLRLDSSFLNGPGNVFTVHGPATGRDSALITAGVQVQWSRYAAYLAWQGDLGRSNYQNQSVLAGFRVSW
jgi:outer membrane autotransporter protein